VRLTVRPVARARPREEAHRLSHGVPRVSWRAGELVSRFEDHALWFPLPEVDHTSVIYITQHSRLKMASTLLDDTAPRPAWCLPGLRPLLRTPERSLSIL
jgi:hypothetical protein